jgi:hypothetical protein
MKDDIGPDLRHDLGALCCVAQVRPPPGNGVARPLYARGTVYFDLLLEQSSAERRADEACCASDERTSERLRYHGAWVA